MTGIPGHNRKAPKRGAPPVYRCDRCGMVAHVFYNDGQQLCSRCDKRMNQ